MVRMRSECKVVSLPQARDIECIIYWYYHTAGLSSVQFDGKTDGRVSDASLNNTLLFEVLEFPEFPEYDESCKKEI